MKKTFLSLLLILTIQLMTNAQTWPEAVTFIPGKANDSVFTKGNLSSGTIISDLSWASSSSNACFTALQFGHYQGNHVFYGTVIPPHSIIRIKATPENPNEEISLYGYMLGQNNMQLVPNLAKCITCEADYKRDRPMRGKPLTHIREIEFNNPTNNSYNIIIGVSAPKGVTDRNFILAISTLL